jgi:hypothetical protein
VDTTRDTQAVNADTQPAPPLDDCDAYEPWQPALATAARVTIGGLSVAAGLLLLAMNLGPYAIDLPFLTLGVLVILGGAALLTLPRMALRVGVPGWLAAGAAVLTGITLNLWTTTVTACCTAAAIIGHGYPFTFLTRSVETAYADGARVFSLLDAFADVAYWGYAALLALVAVGMARRTPRPSAVGVRP